MPPIKNWSRRQMLERGVTAPERVWEHRNTGEIAWLSEKIPNDGYYFMVCPSQADFEDNKHANSDRYGYSHRKDTALSVAAQELRDNTNGFTVYNNSNKQ